MFEVLVYSQLFRYIPFDNCDILVVCGYILAKIFQFISGKILSMSRVSLAIIAFIGTVVAFYSYGLYGEDEYKQLFALLLAVVCIIVDRYWSKPLLTFRASCKLWVMTFVVLALVVLIPAAYNKACMYCFIFPDDVLSFIEFTKLNSPDVVITPTAEASIFNVMVSLSASQIYSHLIASSTSLKRNSLILIVFAISMAVALITGSTLGLILSFVFLGRLLSIKFYKSCLSLVFLYNILLVIGSILGLTSLMNIIIDYSEVLADSLDSSFLKDLAENVLIRANILASAFDVAKPQLTPSPGYQNTASLYQAGSLHNTLVSAIYELGIIGGGILSTSFLLCANKVISRPINQCRNLWLTFSRDRLEFDFCSILLLVTTQSILLTTFGIPSMFLLISRAMRMEENNEK